MDNQKEDQSNEPMASSIFGLGSFMDEIDDSDKKPEASDEKEADKSDAKEVESEAALKQRQQTQ